MNVQAGDMAKLIGGEVPEAIGTILSVDAAASAWEHFIDPYHGPLWRCTTVVGAKCFDSRSKPDYALPGTPVVVPDKWLKRIDPEADDTDTMTTTEREVATS